VSAAGCCLAPPEILQPGLPHATLSQLLERKQPNRDREGILSERVSHWQIDEVNSELMLIKNSLAAYPQKFDMLLEEIKDWVRLWRKPIDLVCVR